MKILNSQIQRIHILLPAGIRTNPDQKKQLVQQYTCDYKKTSTKDLTFGQANELIEKLGGTPINYDNWAFFDYKKASHRNILSLCIQNNWQVWNNKKGDYVADLFRLSEWLKSVKSPVKKPLNKMTSKEVSKIIVALENMAS